MTIFITGSFAVNGLEDIITKKLIVLLNLKWNVKQRKVDYELVDKLRRMSLDKKIDIYNTICYNNCVGNLHKDIDYALNQQFNYQKVMRKVKGKRHV